MKNINIFGLKIMFDIKRNNNSEENIYSSEHSLREKLLYFIIAMFLIAISSKFYILTSEHNYTIGDVARSDIYAPKDIIFKDYGAKEKIIDEMIQNTGKDYIYSSEVEKTYVEYLENFFEIILESKENKVDDPDLEYIEKIINKKIPSDIIKQLLEMPNEKIKNVKRHTIRFLKGAYQAGIVKEKKDIVLKPPYDEKYKNLNDLEKKIVDLFLTPNYIYDEQKTKQNIKEKVSQIKDQYQNIKAGTLIAKTGELLNDRKISILESYGIYSYKSSVFIFLFNIIYLGIISSLFYYTFFNTYKKEILNKNIYRASFLIIVGTLLACRVFSENVKYLIPVNLAFFLLVLLSNKEYATHLYLFILMFLLPIINYDLIYFVIYIIGITYARQVLKKVNTRSSLIAGGVQLSILQVVLYLLFTFFIVEESFGVAVNATYILLSGFLTGMLTIAFLPYFEKTFNILTIFRLLELGDLSHPLLKKISVEAPGTFQHSMMVSTLSENAAAAIGANSVFCRVASYYHDLGKTKRPKFYVENQENGENPHNKISPFMSTLIITSHTKDGDEMAKPYLIPKEIRSIMYEHQGTGFLAYFYNEAKKIDPNVRKDEFRYSGPKPKTKESAIIMLADSIEAAIRSLDEKTVVTMETMIRKIINSKIEDNQLSEANLTFSEIEVIIKTFVKTLVSIHHVRIKYPGQK